MHMLLLQSTLYDGHPWQDYHGISTITETLNPPSLSQLELEIPHVVLYMHDKHVIVQIQYACAKIKFAVN